MGLLAIIAAVFSMVAAFSSMWLAWYLMIPCKVCGKVGNRGLIKPCCAMPAKK
ncbi:MAG: hypothetical protein HY028_01715 [Gammaproteobacteria bacterium]|nr:hypothetical protein [Gammaproteobacteria bacterium]